MLDFDSFVGRHGEVVAQAMLENLERHEGIRHTSLLPLHVRWANVMPAAEIDDQRIAA